MRALIRRTILLAMAAVCGAPAFAHGGHARHAEPPGWTWDPWITVPLAVSALVFALVGGAFARDRTLAAAASFDVGRCSQPVGGRWQFRWFLRSTKQASNPLRPT